MYNPKMVKIIKNEADDLERELSTPEGRENNRKKVEAFFKKYKLNIKR